MYVYYQYFLHKIVLLFYQNLGNTTWHDSLIQGTNEDNKVVYGEGLCFNVVFLSNHEYNVKGKFHKNLNFDVK